MGMSHYRRPMAAWMACFAVLLASLAPAVSHGINAFRLAEVSMHAHCDEVGDEAHQSLEEASERSLGLSAQAFEHGEHLSRDAAPKNTSHAGHEAGGNWHFEHCPFCFTHAGSFGLAPVIFLASQMGMSVTLCPALFYLSPHPLFAWTSAQPRAPPAIS